MPPLLVFWFFVLLLTVLLWVPLSRLFFVLGARRAERRDGQVPDRAAQDRILKHARAVAAVVAMAISWGCMLSMSGGGVA